jgi:two-component system phosphate regulon sensor histidine kinase PhoR
MTPRPAGRRKFFWKLFAGCAVLMTLALGICVLLIVRELEQFYGQELTTHLRAQAVTLQSQIKDILDVAHTAQLDAIAKEVGGHEADGIRVTIVALDGTVLGDSQADITKMDSHRNRKEIRAAIANGWGESTRWSDTLGRMLKYVAVRVGPEDSPKGVVRVALAVTSVGARTQAMRSVIWTIGIVAALAALIFALGLAQMWTKPIRLITQVADRLSHGDLSARAEVRGSDELAHIAHSLNEMGDHLHKQLSTIDGQRQTLKALLDQLQEGVIVAGPDGRIILSNPAAVTLLHPDGTEPAVDPWAGRHVEECVPQPILQRLLRAGGAEPCVAEAELDRNQASETRLRADQAADDVRLEIPAGGGPVMLLARASDIEMPGHAVSGKEPGTAPASLTGRVLALTDITEIARTIQMKTDFVANASHELRTPLSAVRAAVETLLDADISNDVDSAKRFLHVIERHSTRLEALVADLLALSRLESTPRRSKPTAVGIRRFCNELHERWSTPLDEKHLQWHCDISPELEEMTVDLDLLSMAVDNLIDNAIKFTPSAGHVSLGFNTNGADVIVEVTDDGCGIPPEDQERVFERFYQVARARSAAESPEADARGTGLGLAIVRHAVTSMGGAVSITSKVGEGTRVSMTIPMRRSAG